MQRVITTCSLGLLALAAGACGSLGDGTHYQPSRVELRGLHILRLVGTPYQMGRQQGEPMTAKIQQLADFTETDQGYSPLLAVAETGGLTDAALEHSYPTYNPYTELTNPPDLIDGGGSIGDNGTVHSMVFPPAQRALYVSMGEQPVPPNPCIGFSFDELFEQPNGVPPDPAQIE